MTDHNDTGATARPWRVEEGTTLIWGACNPDDLSSYGMGHPVAQACLSHGWNKRHEPTIDQAMANAALIVEAVNAYEPLKARLAEVERERDIAREANKILAHGSLGEEILRKKAEARIAVLEKTLGRIAVLPECGCKPCTGQCRSQAVLLIELEEIRALAAVVLAAEQKEAGSEQ